MFTVVDNTFPVFPVFGISTSGFRNLKVIPDTHTHTHSNKREEGREEEIKIKELSFFRPENLKNETFNFAIYYKIEVKLASYKFLLQVSIKFF